MNYEITESHHHDPRKRRPAEPDKRMTQHQQDVLTLQTAWSQLLRRELPRGYAIHWLRFASLEECLYLVELTHQRFELGTISNPEAYCFTSIRRRQGHPSPHNLRTPQPVAAAA